MARKSPKRGKSSPFERYRPAMEKAIYILSLLGVLVVVHLWIQQGRGFDRGCLGFTTSEAFEASFDCEAVVESGAGTLLGISNAIWGLLFYLGVAALTFAVALRRTSDLRRLKQLRMGFVTVGLLYSAYLVYYQANSLGGYCALCLISAGVVASLFLVHVLDLRSAAKDTVPASNPPMKKPLPFYAGLAALTVVLAGADLAYFSSLPETPLQVASADESGAARQASADGDDETQCSYNAEVPRIDNWEEFVGFGDPMKGNPNATVTMLTYFDPNCPHCRSLHPIVEQVIEDHGDDARFVFKPFPLWQQSVVQVQALYAAAQEGKFFEMMDRQFQLQRREGLSLEILKQIATDIGMDPQSMQQRIEAGLYNSIIGSEREKGLEAGVRGMPTVIINGRFVAGTSRSRECLGALIEREAENI